MGLLTLYINNKAGGLIFHRVRCSLRTPAPAPTQIDVLPTRRLQDFAPHAAKLDVNEHLRLASTYSGLALIMQQLSPVPKSSRMELIEADSFVLQSFDTLTGLKFFLTADPDSKHLDAVLREVYVLYSDYVLKNPFYELDMPIHCERFDEKLAKLAEDYNRR